MKFAIILFVLAAVAFATCSPAKGSTKAALRKKECLKDCGDLYKPVCAGDGVNSNKSFGSECVLANHNCEHDINLKIVSEGECPGGGGVRLS